MKWLLLFFAGGVMAQVPTVLSQGNQANEKAQQELTQALTEANASPMEAIRALEAYLKKYPDAPARAEIERMLVKAAIDTKDDRRTALYGELVLATAPDDVVLLDRVARAELALGGSENAAKALEHAKVFEAIIVQLGPGSGRDAGRKQEERDRSLARMLLYQSRAKSQLGKKDEAEPLAARAFSVYPNEESAREWSVALAAMGRHEDAVQRLADAFAIPDARASDADRATDRKLLGEIYRKLHGSEKGLGDVILSAYDRTAALLEERLKRMKAIDPNTGVIDPMDFTLTGVDGSKLALASLRGSVVVLDFWATWCQPCRIQHPLYEEVKKRFRGRKDVVFLGINADEDRSLVDGFLENMQWSRANVYYEDGLQRFLQVSAIPSTIVFDKQGRIASRMNGFLPETFVEQLTERIASALRESSAGGAK
ncbi:MAG TPA: thioredoxin-like domain-containing protein [Bryobacteraceae bacterium]|nr:thioredoxin-like domain-containing protein [Bryobacteraceae bacterium]